MENLHDTKNNEASGNIASDLSQVNIDPKRSQNIKTILGITVVGAIILFTLFFCSGEDKKPIQEPTPATTLKDSHDDELQKNLEKLRKENQSIKTQMTTFQQQVETPAASSQMLARQNAPTTMYHASISQVTDPSGNTTSAPFAGHSAYDQFGNQATTSDVITAKRVAHPEYSVVSGEFMHAILETAINSDLPGMVRAIISTPVYAYTGETPLIPAGSRLIGQYSSTVLQGQNRVFVIWNRVILPNGINAQLNSPGVDALGIAGQGADSINTHFLARFGQASLLSIIGAGVANYGVQPQDQFNSSASYRAAMAQSFQQSAQQSLQNTMQTQPTISVHQGAEINVFVSRDIDFYSVLAKGAR